MSYDRGDVVIVPFPFVTHEGAQQKARPAVVISDHSIQRRFDDVILAAITSQRIEDVSATEFLIEERTPGFAQSGLARTSVVRCEFIMTVPKSVISRKLGSLPKNLMDRIDELLGKSIGLAP